MKQIYLTEYRRSRTPYVLTTHERDLISRHINSIAIEPARRTPGAYYLTPTSIVGALELDTLAIQIKPKISIKHLLFLISYSLDPDNWLDTDFDLTEDSSLSEAIAPAFLRHLKTVFSRSMLQGYKRREDTVNTVQGQIRFSDQIRKRFGIMLPIEVTYDEFTEDIVENQLIKAALIRLLNCRVRSSQISRELKRYVLAFDSVSRVAFDPHHLPEVKFNRRNNRYKHAVQIARLILRSSSFDQSSGNVRARSFLVDMNQVFEDFVVVALRENLGLSTYSFPQNADGRTLTLDDQRRIRLKPDISWWKNGRCCFVGDVKYKSLNRQARNADIYQVLSYAVATQLPMGILIYAKDQATPYIRSESHNISLADKQLRVVALDLANRPEDILIQINEIGDLIREHVLTAIDDQPTESSVL